MDAAVVYLIGYIAGMIAMYLVLLATEKLK